MTPVKNIHLLTKALRLLPLVFVLIALSCQNESRENAADETQRDVPSEAAPDMESPLATLPYIVAFNEGSEQLEAEKNPDFDQTLLTVDALTQALRTNYPEIGLEIDRVSDDTLFVQITDARYLTQQMGSSGAQTYIMEATYAYTELPDIALVHFDFAEGDHAVPGTYTRAMFE